MIRQENLDYANNISEDDRLILKVCKIWIILDILGFAIAVLIIR